MLESILSKTALIVFSLAMLIASGSMVSSFYFEQDMNESAAAFQQIVSIVRQADSFGGEWTIRLEMKSYLGSDSILRIGNGSMVLLHEGRTFSANLEDDVLLKVLDDRGSEAAMIEISQGDVLVLERHWDSGAFQTIIYIEKVDATFSTAFTNRSTSSTVL